MSNYRRFFTNATLFLSFVGIFGIAEADTLMDTIPFDTGELKSIRVEGSNSRLNFSTNPSQSMGVSVNDRGGYECEMLLTTKREGQILTVHLEERRNSVLFDVFSHCDSKVTFNLPPGISVDVALSKTVAKITGHYDTFAIAGDEAVFDFEGQVSQVDLSGRKLVARMIVNKADTTRAIHLKADVLLADLGFAVNTALSYRIDAPVVVFERGIPEASQFGTRIEISAMVLKGSTYVASSAL